MIARIIVVIIVVIICWWIVCYTGVIGSSITSSIIRNILNCCSLISGLARCFFLADQFLHLRRQPIVDCLNLSGFCLCLVLNTLSFICLFGSNCFLSFILYFCLLNLSAALYGLRSQFRIILIHGFKHIPGSSKLLKC